MHFSSITLINISRLFRTVEQVNKKIFVRGLPWETTDQSLRAVFEQYGVIAEVGVFKFNILIASFGQE